MDFKVILRRRLDNVEEAFNMKGVINMQLLRIFIVHVLSALSAAVVYVLGIDYDGYIPYFLISQYRSEFLMTNIYLVSPKQ